MGTRQIEMREVISAKIADVFERLIDHEGMSKWPGIGACELIVEGNPRNGLGAIRRVRVRGLTIDEEVVRYEPPHAFDYAIRRGLPVDDHLGEVRLVEKDGDVEVTWRIRLKSKWPFLADLIGNQLEAGLPKALRYVKAELEPRAHV